MSLKSILASFTVASLAICALTLTASAQSSQKQLDLAAARAQRKATVGAKVTKPLTCPIPVSSAAISGIAGAPSLVVAPRNKSACRRWSAGRSPGDPGRFTPT